MAQVIVKLFGVLRVDTSLARAEVSAERACDIFDTINSRVTEIYEEKRQHQPDLEKPDEITFKNALVFINGERCGKKNMQLQDGDEIWIMSPASGG